MAMMEFNYSYTNAQLGDILGLAISLIVEDDLREFELRPQSLLHFVLNEGGLGHGAGFEIDAYPAPQKGPPIFFIIQGDIFGHAKNGNEVAIFTPNEIREAICMELSNQAKREPKYVTAVKKIAEALELPVEI